MILYQDRHPDVGIVYRRGILEFWIPSKMQPELATRYNPRHVPAIPLFYQYHSTRVLIWAKGTAPPDNHIVWRRVAEFFK